MINLYGQELKKLQDTTENIEYSTEYEQNKFDSMSVNTEILDPREDKWHKRREKGIYFSNSCFINSMSITKGI